MTSIGSIKVRCALCGVESEQLRVYSTHLRGYADLDTRPPERQRSTMHAWLQRCPECDYCYSDISSSVGGERAVIASPPYQDALRLQDRDALATLFRCKSLIDEAAGRYAVSARSAMHAAWVFDDSSEEVSARSARERAVKLISLAVDAGQNFADGSNTECAIVVDLLRRAGHLQDAKSHLDLHGDSTREPVVVKILAYQRQLIENSDTECLTLDAALAAGEDP